MKIKKGILRSLVLLFLLSFIIVACEKVSFPPVEVSDVKFKADIQPILDKNCIKCHPPTQGLDLTSEFSYNELVPKYASVADSANPEKSKLYVKLTGTAHQPRTSDTEKQKILNWISQGVPNN